MAEGNGESNIDGWKSEEERVYYEHIVALVRADGVTVEGCCEEVAKSVFQVLLEDLRKKAEVEKAAKAAAVEDDEFVAEIMHGHM